MDKSVFAAALALILSTAAPALALDDHPSVARCGCFCEVAGVNWLVEYYDIGLGCAAFNNRTCNVEDPTNGEIRSGRTRGCEPDNTGITGAADILLNGGVLQQATPPATRPGLTAPQPGAVFQQ
jgi:hypothetical protein